MKPQCMSEKVDLHYSPDDNGWYFQEYDYKFRDRVSQVFATKAEALKAWHEHKLDWRKV